MIGDAVSTNDFFIKPKDTSRPEELPKQGKPQEKAFANKLKEVAENDSHTDRIQDRFSKRSSKPAKEAPIQKRAPATQPKSDDYEPSVKEQNIPTGRGDISTAKPIPKAPVQDPEDDSDAIDEASMKEVKNDPNIQLLALVASPQFDVKDLSPGELKEVKEALRDQQSQVRQASVQKFMTELQSKFGVTPDKVVQAFAKMDEQTLAAPSGETVSKFVNNLGVKAQDKNQIAVLYKQMLSETGDAALNEKLLGSDDDKSVSLKVMDSTQAKLAQLNKSIDNLNDNFFRKGQFQAQAQGQVPTSIRDQLKKLTEANDNDSDDASAAPAGLGALLAQLGDKAGAISSGAAATTADTGMATATQAPQAIDMSTYARMNSSFNSNLGQNSEDGESAAQDQSRGAKIYSAQNAQAPATRSFAEMTKVKTESASPIRETSTATASQTSVVGQTAPAAAGTTAATLTPQAMMMTGPTKQESTENVQELIKQAQVIIKKGGGEMNVEMKPEGMGQVHLKVAVENGQVSIQMMAQNDKVKKLIEEGIHELKGNLAAHKIQVESLKVGIAGGGLADKKMDQQQGEAQREAMKDAQREMARNFAGDMRDERQDRQSAFTDVPGWKAYRANNSRANVESSSSPQEMSMRRRDENRRLSLVA